MAEESRKTRRNRIVTVALQSRQNVSKPVQIPAGTDYLGLRECILSQSAGKLNQSRKKLDSACLINLRTKRAIDTFDDWDELLHGHEHAQLLFEFARPGGSAEKDKELQASSESTHVTSRRQVPATKFDLGGALVTADARKQIDATIETYSDITHVVIQPDCHAGNTHPTGGVFVSRGSVYPRLIGGDIGCGMGWFRTELSRSRVEGDKAAEKVAKRLVGLEGEWRTQAMRETWLDAGRGPGRGNLRAGPVPDKALGTIGAGNHFAEIQVIERSETDACSESGVVLLVHSGSRAYGGEVAKRCEKNVLIEGSPELRNYLDEHDRACEWARANRELIALRFLVCLEPGEPAWEVGLNDDKSYTPEQVLDARRSVRSRLIVDIWHNNVERIRSPASHNGPPQTEYIHRKGAAPTRDCASGKHLALLPLPGSRATPTLLLSPTHAEANEFGALNAFSVAHGAGRALSRSSARVKLNNKYKGDTDAQLKPSTRDNPTKEQKDGSNVRGGTWVICDEKDLVWEEAHEAYKDVYEVAALLEEAEVAKVVGWARPRVSYKVRKETEGVTG